MSDKEQERPQTYIGLDVVRFCAALAVAFYHLSFWWWLPTVTGGRFVHFQVAYAPLAEVTRWGYVGVPIFFVLSGFIIAASALGRSAGGFLRSRILRLYPAVWICTPILLAVTHERTGLVATTLRTFALWPRGPWLSGVFWTLGVEIVFYAFIAVAIALGVSLWRAGAAFGLAGATFWILRAFDFAFGGRFETVFATVEQSTIGGLVVVQSCFFGVGIALWAINRDGASLIKLALLACFIFAGCIATYAGGRFEIAHTGVAGHAYYPTLAWLTATVLTAVSIWLQPIIWQRFGTCSYVFRAMGLATYPLYLIQSELGMWIMHTSTLPPSLALSVALVAVVTLAFIIVALERWPRSVLRRLLHSKSKAIPAADLP